MYRERNLIKSFESQFSKQGSLGPAWDKKGTEHAALDDVPKGDLKADPPELA